MSSDEIERRLRDALAARAEDAVDDVRPVPPPRFLTDPVPARHRTQWPAPVAAAVAVLALIGGVFASVRTGYPAMKFPLASVNA